MSFDSFKISAIVYPESDGERRVWIAQCLEYDIVSQGETIEKVMNRLARDIAATICVSDQEGKKAFEGISEAPRKYWEMFKRATVVIEREEPPLRSQRPLPSIRPVAKLIETVPA